MVRVTGIDHLVISVGDFDKSKAFYAPLMEFLGFGVEAEYAGHDGLGQRQDAVLDQRRRRRGPKAQIPQGRYRLSPLRLPSRSRKDVDALQAFLEEQGATIVDPAGEYYDDYYAVFFLDPDGMKLEGMRYGEKQ